MLISIINFRDLSIGLRLDSEYYKPLHLKYENIIKRKKTRKLKELVDSIKSFGAYSLCNEISYVEKGIPFIRCQDVKEGYVDFNNILYIDENSNKILFKSEIKKDTVLLTMSGSVGNSAILNGNSSYPINSNQDIAKINTNNEIDSHYLSIFFNSKYGKNQTDRIPIGSIQQHIFIWQLELLDIPILHKRFQLLIKSLYNKYFNLKNISEEKYSSAESLLLSELDLIDWKPKHKLSFIKNYSEVEQAERMDAEYFQPKYEEIIDKIKKYNNGNDSSLKNFVKLKKSIEPGSDEYLEEGIPFVRVSNLNKFELNDNNQQFISEEFYNNNIKHQPQKGQILFSKDASPGIAYYINEEPKRMIVSGGILLLEMLENCKMYPEVLTLILNSEIVQKQMERDIGGSVILHWRPEQIENVLIPNLDDVIQSEIKNKVIESFDLREKSKKLLEIAKLGVEKAIEEDEAIAENWINEELTKLGISL